jgi:hypothetical protein
MANKDDNWVFNNEISLPKMIYILWIIFLLLLLSWFSINQPRLAEDSIWYFIFGAFGLIVWLIDFNIKQVGNELISTSLWETSVFGKLKPMHYLLLTTGSLFWAAFSFFNTATSKQSIIGAPKVFQIIELGVTGDVLTSLSFAVMENLIFFYFIVPTIFGISYKASRSPLISMITAVFIGGIFVFPIYHLLTYGLTDISATIGVMSFGFMNSLIVLLIRNPIFTDTWHIANNLGILVAKTTKVGLSVFGSG